jgi:hypothetical protein
MPDHDPRFALYADCTIKAEDENVGVLILAAAMVSDNEAGPHRLRVYDRANDETVFEAGESDPSANAPRIPGSGP